jgi:hypothetical protein
MNSYRVLPEEVDEFLDVEGAELLGELIGSPVDEVRERLAKAVESCPAQHVREVAGYLIGLAGALGSLAEALADGRLDPAESRDLRTISGEEVSDLTDLIHLLVPEVTDLDDVQSKT